MYSSLEKQQKDSLKLHNYEQDMVNEGQACFFAIQHAIWPKQAGRL